MVPLSTDIDEAGFMSLHAGYICFQQGKWEMRNHFHIKNRFHFSPPFSKLQMVKHSQIQKVLRSMIIKKKTTFYFGT